MSWAHRLADRVFGRFADVLLQRADERLLHPRRLLHAVAQQEAADYARDHMAAAINLAGQAEVLAHAIGRAPGTGSVLEFGVGDGVSIGLIAGRVAGPVHGFDSFEGLPEDWPGRHEGKGHYSRGGQAPRVPANVTLHKGWFEDTLPAFLESHGEPVAFLHVDCDLYGSTRTVLNHLAPRIKPGTVIVFDEYFNFISWRDHEFKAFQEFVAGNQIRYSYICWGFQQAAVRIDAVGGGAD